MTEPDNSPSVVVDGATLMKEALDWFGNQKPSVLNNGRLRIGLSLFLGFLLFSVALLFTSWLGDQVSQSGSVMNRFISRIQSSLIAQTVYDAKGQRDIVVILIDDEYLQAMQSPWPIAYQDHADLMEAVAVLPPQKPLSLFWDISFQQPRRDSTLPALGSRMCEISQEHGVPVYVAAVERHGKLRQRPDLEAFNASGEPPCFQNVDVRLCQDPLDGVAWTYPIHHEIKPSQSGPCAPSGPTAAVAIYEGTNAPRLEDRERPIALTWGLLHSEGTVFPHTFGSCEAGRYDGRRYVPHFPRWVLVQFGLIAASQRICPYHSTISASRLLEMEPDEVAQLVGGRHVMVGGVVPGYNDIVTSPLHGVIPGVFYHAMALDNLLVSGAKVKRHADWSNRNTDFWLASIATVIIVFCMFALGARIPIPETIIPTASQSEHGLSPGQLLTERFRSLVGKGCVWSIKIVALYIFSLFLLLAYHRIFDIGLVPLTELVSMVLLIQGFRVMEKLRELFGNDTSCKHQTPNPPNLDQGGDRRADNS